MRYLKQFESQVYYHFINLEEYNDLLTISCFPATSEERVILSNLLPVKTWKFNNGKKFLQIILKSYPQTFDYTIHKIEDEYYLVLKQSSSGFAISRVKCDQLDGLIQYLRDEGVITTNHIRFKTIFESTNQEIERMVDKIEEKYYEEIHPDEVSSLNGQPSNLSNNKLPIYNLSKSYQSNKQERKILQQLFDWNYELTFHNYSSDGRLQFLTIYDRSQSKGITTIFKLEDEWFIVIETISYRTKYFKCDQLDGLIQYLKDRILK